MLSFDPIMTKICKLDMNNDETLPLPRIPHLFSVRCF